MVENCFTGQRSMRPGSSAAIIAAEGEACPGTARLLARSPPRRRASMSKRELIDTGTDKRYVRRDEKGQFKESDDVGKSLAADRRQKAEHESRKGQGDRGDRRD